MNGPIVRPPLDVRADGRVGDRWSVFDVPIALWAYAFLRALAFLAPAATVDGSIGLGVVVVPVIFLFVVRRSRLAYQILVLLDLFSAVMTVTVWLDTDDNPLSIPILTGLALVALLWPSNWRYVSGSATTERPSADRSHRSATRGY